MESERGQVWPYLLLSVALVGALGFGAYQTRLKDQYIRDAENKYMSAFHKLKWTSENIEERMAKLLATNDRQMQESLLADLRVFSAQAVEHTATLPVANMNTPRVTSFLNTLRQQTDEQHFKLTQGGSLSDQDWASLMELRKQAVYFEDQLSSLLGLIGNNRIRWAPTVQATRTGLAGGGATPITKSVLTLEKDLPVPPGEENALDPRVGALPPPKMDLGPKVDPQTAKSKILEFAEAPLKGDPVQTGTSEQPAGDGGLALYYFNATKQNGTPMNFGVSIHGGHIIFMIDGRPVNQRRLSQDELISRARQMMEKWGYRSAIYVSAVENDNTLVIDFAPRQDGVSLQTELIKVSLAMDNGELTGFDARNYWINHHDRRLEKPRLSATEARGRVARRLQVTGTPELALVADTLGQERLSWEVRGQVDDQRFRIFIDAHDGREINIIRVIGDPAPPMKEG